MTKKTPISHCQVCGKEFEHLDLVYYAPIDNILLFALGAQKFIKISNYGCIMTKLKGVMLLSNIEKKIEELRSKLNSLSALHLRTSKEVLEVSQELDEHLLAYQKAYFHMCSPNKQNRVPGGTVL